MDRTSGSGFDDGRLALAVVLVDYDAREAIRAANVVLVCLVPWVAVRIHAPALAIPCVAADRDGLAAAVVLWIGGVGRALEARDAARGARPAVSAALLVCEGARSVARIENALTVVLIFFLADERWRAAGLVVVIRSPRAGRLVVIVAPALAVHWIQTQVHGLALAVVLVDHGAVVIQLATRIAGEALATTLVELLIHAVGDANDHTGGD